MKTFTIFKFRQFFSSWRGVGGVGGWDGFVAKVIVAKTLIDLILILIKDLWNKKKINNLWSNKKEMIVLVHENHGWNSQMLHQSNIFGVVLT